MGTTIMNAKKRQLREAIDNTNLSPEIRLRAAKSLLKTGSTEDNIPYIRRAIAAFEFNPNAVISRRAEKLKVKFEAALEARKQQLAEKRAAAQEPAPPVPEPEVVAAAPPPPPPITIEEAVDGFELLPETERAGLSLDKLLDSTGYRISDILDIPIWDPNYGRAQSELSRLLKALLADGPYDYNPFDHGFFVRETARGCYNGEALDWAEARINPPYARVAMTATGFEIRLTTAGEQKKLINYVRSSRPPVTSWI